MTLLIHARRLSDESRPKLEAHFLSLSSDDLHLRFGTSLSKAAIADYVARIDFDRDAVFAVHDDELAIVGVAHLARNPDAAELGLSVAPGFRGKGIGSALFRRAHEHARNHLIRALFMHCLAENETMMRIARKAGMKIVIHPGEAQAFLDLPPWSPATIAQELIEDQAALCDFALKSQVLASRGVIETTRLQK
ncbi:MAG: GNAT family N-acetyltransferase [Burkholderiales bacterium]